MSLSFIENSVELSETLFNEQRLHDLHHYKSLLERSESVGRMGYWEYDLRNDILWISKGARVIYGVGDCDISLIDIKAFTFPEYHAKLDQMFENFIFHDGKYEFEFKIRRAKDGEIAYIRSQSDYNIQERKIYGIIHDISLQKSVENELINATERAKESDKLKSTFVSNMSHEIRTPMNGIVGLAHLLAETELDHTTRKEYRDSIYICCNNLLSRINDILDIATIESGLVIISNEHIPITGLLKEILEKHSPEAHEKALDLRLTPSDSLQDRVIITDKQKCKKIFTILIENSIRFTNSGYIEFGYHILENFIEFYVKDTGIGISPSQHEIIFQPFCQANGQISNDYGGTGLGLAIAKTYVNMLGGSMWLESKSGRGATFFFTLPYPGSDRKQSVRSSVTKKPNLPKNCLVVEDNEMNFAYLKAMLTPMGFTVLWAKDGNEGIAIALTNYEIDLILMDIRLPNIDGYEATRIIKEKRPDLPIIAQSANAILEERNKALQAGCDDYITKPIYKEEFKTILDELFTP